MRSSDSVAVRYAGKAAQRLDPLPLDRHRLGRRGPSGWHRAPAFFETGLMSTDGVTGWDGAQWIGMKGKTPDSPGRRCCARRQPSGRRHRQVREARLYVSALGVYDAYVNGHHVTVPQDGGTTIELLPPGWTNYDARVELHDLRRHGPRATREPVSPSASSWATAGTTAGSPTAARTTPKDGNALAVKAKLLIRYADGTVADRRHGPDGGWKATDTGPYRADDIYDGQTYDARRELPGWTAHGFDDTAWSDVERVAFDEQVPGLPARSPIPARPRG